MSEEEPREEDPRHKGHVPRRRRITQRAVIVLSVLAVVLTTAFVIAYKKLEGNINSVSIAEQLGVTVLDEDQFTALLEGGPSALPPS